MRLMESQVSAVAEKVSALKTAEYFAERRDRADFDAFDRAIDIQIGRIRKKIRDDVKSPKLIKTIRGVGYMFCGKTDTQPN